MFIAHGEWVRKHARWILGGILLLLIPGFVALFTTTGGSARRESDLPTVQGKPVNVPQYEKARNAILAQYIMNAGRQPLRTPDFEDQLKQQAVLRIVMLQKAKKLGIRVTDDQIQATIESQPVFHDQNGHFDPNRYGPYAPFFVFLNNHGISLQFFEEIMREDVILQQLQVQVATAAKVTPAEVELVFKPLHEKLSIALVEFDTENSKESVTVTEDEAKAFYEQNQESFRRPAQVKIRYARFSLSDAKKAIKLADDEITEFYERNKMKYTDTNNVAKPLASVRTEVEEELLSLRAERAAGDRATELTVKLVHEPGQQKPDFAKVCTEFGAQAQETAYLSKTNNAPGIEAGPEFNRAAFALGPDANAAR